MLGLSERAPQNPVDNHHQSSFFLILHLGDIPLTPSDKAQNTFQLGPSASSVTQCRGFCVGPAADDPTESCRVKSVWQSVAMENHSYGGYISIGYISI